MAAQKIAILLLVAASSLAQDTPSSQTLPSISRSGEIGQFAHPGATVSASNSSTGEKTATSTDINGAYTLQVAGLGKYEVRVEMPAFDAGTREVVWKARPGARTWSLTLLSRTQQAATPKPRPSTTQANRGFQSLSVMQGMAQRKILVEGRGSDRALGDAGAGRGSRRGYGVSVNFRVIHPV